MERLREVEKRIPLCWMHDHLSPPIGQLLICDDETLSKINSNRFCFEPAFYHSPDGSLEIAEISLVLKKEEK
jgi:hypothetical protein